MTEAERGREKKVWPVKQRQLLCPMERESSFEGSRSFQVRIAHIEMPERAPPGSRGERRMSGLGERGDVDKRGAINP